MKIGEKIRIEPIWDHKHGRRFQIIVVNETPGESFTIHKDMMARDYLKLKLTDADLLMLIQEINKGLGSPDFDPQIVQSRFRGSHLRVVKEEDGNDAG